MTTNRTATRATLLRLTVVVGVVLLASLPARVTGLAAAAGPAPVPESARGPAIPREKGYLVQQVRDGLYWVTDGTYQAMFLTTGQGVIAVDAPPSIGKNLLKAIADVTSEPVTHVIYSHSHKDHIGAAGLFPKTATYIAHADTAALLARAKDPDRPVPTVTFADAYTLKVGTQTLVLDYKGVNHEPGNIFIYAPRQKVLMLVDVIVPGWVPFKYLALAKDVSGFIGAHDAVLGYDFDTFIGGHLTRLGTRQDVEIQREYVADLKANAATANQTTDFMTIAKQTGFDNRWLLFNTYLNAVAQACTDATLPKWINRLGGADVFTFDNCWMMMVSLRTD